MEPVIERIGDLEIRHGERWDSSACLCGHPDYLMCPGWPAGGIVGAELRPVEQEA